jgi:putative toxin-antitoxin system antitoxin component (TIGR02293 family)
MLKGDILMAARIPKTPASPVHSKRRVAAVAAIPAPTRSATPSVLALLGQRSRGAVSYRAIYAETLGAYVEALRAGIPSETVKGLAGDLKFEQGELIERLGLARSTMSRKIKNKNALTSPEGEVVLGVARLIGQVQQMVNESGEPEGFDAAAWLGRWLRTPIPALGGHEPAEFMDTAAGQTLISNLLLQMQTGAYA